MTAVVLRGDARHLPLPDSTVDLIVTSPPYWSMRSYSDNGEHYDGQIGSEATPGEFLVALLDCTREWVRVLKPEGSLFVNLGDKYAQDIENSRNGLGQRAADLAPFRTLAEHTIKLGKRDNGGTQRKSLMGLPWRYALACMDDLGLILRAEVVWAKPNGLPESVTDRVRRAHEQVFHFTKQPRYYAAVDSIREPHVEAWRSGKREKRAHLNHANDAQHGRDQLGTQGDGRDYNPLGKLPGSVWEIPSQPLTVPAHLGIDHFAAFPPALVRPIILGWSPPGICTACGQGRRPSVTRDLRPYQGRVRLNSASGTQKVADLDSDGSQGGSGHNSHGYPMGETVATITGYACACPDATAPTRPAIVLDPFGGTGTTALVASVLGRDAVTVDMSADYCRLARWRTTDPGERAKALGVPKPPPVPDGQGDLFEAV